MSLSTGYTIFTDLLTRIQIMNNEKPSPTLYPGIDVELTTELKEVLEDSFDELIDIFLEDTPEQIEGMADAIAKGDLSRIRSYAHILNGSCSNFGAHRIDALANEIRAICKSTGDDRVNLIRLLGDIQSEYTVVAQSLSALRNDTKSAT